MTMDTKGGRITVDINGVRFSTRGKAKIMPSRISLANGANQDGTGFSTVNPKLAGLDCTFDRGGQTLRWDEAMLLEQINVTFTETDTKPPRVHLFTGARWDGDPELNTEDGEVTGLKIVTDQYTPPQ